MSIIFSAVYKNPLENNFESDTLKFCKFFLFAMSENCTLKLWLENFENCSRLADFYKLLFRSRILSCQILTQVKRFFRFHCPYSSFGQGYRVRVGKTSQFFSLKNPKESFGKSNLVMGWRNRALSLIYAKRTHFFMALTVCLGWNLSFQIWLKILVWKIEH